MLERYTSSASSIRWLEILASLGSSLGVEKMKRTELQHVGNERGRKFFINHPHIELFMSCFTFPCIQILQYFNALPSRQRMKVGMLFRIFWNPFSQHPMQWIFKLDLFHPIAFYCLGRLEGNWDFPFSNCNWRVFEWSDWFDVTAVERAPVNHIRFPILDFTAAKNK